LADFEKVAQLSQLPSGSLKPVTTASGAEVCLVNLDGEVYALGDVCSHAHCSISDGDIEDGSVICPCHGGGFDVKTGQVTFPPPMIGVAVYQVRVEGDDIFVAEG
jgi:3-phenylpropionate/trans-cinnamate dioxygenase ferredoxin component